jgi:flagellar hook-length control protein FliK
MAHTYIRFDFGTDEEKAQQARHKLDGWKQAFRLDKRVQYKLDRPESAEGEATAKPEAATAKPAAAEKSKAKATAKSAGKTASKHDEAAGKKTAPPSNGKVGLLVRLYFSSHEKLSEQRWVERIPSEEPFKGAAPKVIHQNDPEFEETDKQFEALT